MRRRRLLPRAEWGGWGGDGPAHHDGSRDEAKGCYLCIQWFGLIVEIGIGRAS